MIEMPRNDEAERVVLGSILIDNSAFDRVADIVRAEDFRDALHRRVYGAMGALEGRGIDALTVREKLAEDGELVAISRISALCDGIPNIAQVEKYAEIVRDTALRRRVIVECQRLQKAALDNTPVGEIAASGADLFAECAEARAEGPRPIESVVKRAAEDLEARMLAGRFMTGIPTGIPDVDHQTLGLQRGVLSLGGARPRVGKTAFGLSIALRAAAEGLRTVFFEFDMSEAMIRNRVLASTARVSSFKLRSGQGVTSAEMARVAQSAARLSAFGADLLIDHRSRDIRALAAITRREARKRLDLVIIDHIGHVQGGRGEKRYLQLGDVSARLIELADTTNVAMFALVQLGRSAEEREPTLADLRESGNLEQDARLAILLDRPALRGEARNECDLVMHIAKNEGEAGQRISTHFALATQRVTQSVDETCRYCEYVSTDGRVEGVV